MDKKIMGFVAVAAMLAVEMMGASSADAQGILRGRSRGRFTRTQCCTTANNCATGNCATTNNCLTNCSTGNCGTAPVSFAAQTVAYSQPIVSSSVVASGGCNSCGGGVGMSGAIQPIPMDSGLVMTGSYVSDGAFSGGFESAPAVGGCQSCGSIQPATYSEAAYGQPVYDQGFQGEYFGGDSGCVGCGETQGVVYEGGAVQGCASGDCGGGAVIQGGVIEGEVIQGEEYSSPSSNDVPDPPSDAPTAADSDQDA